METAKQNANSQIPLCVDLDGTYLRTDSLYECLWAGIASRPFIVFFIFVWLMKGKSYLKSKLAEFGRAGMSVWPKNSGVEELIRLARQKGQAVYLVTAADEEVARGICETTDLFDGYFASRPGLNLKCEKKAQLLVEKFGEGKFHYIGDCSADKKVWAKAAQGWKVSYPGEKCGDNLNAVSIEKPGLKTYLRMLRIHQWMKNLLLFVPLFAAHEFTDFTRVLTIFLGFISMSVLASGTYIFNDLLDLTNDRSRESKRSRPLASGLISLRTGSLVAIGCILSAMVLSFTNSMQFGLALLVYGIVSVSYSIILKRLLLVDVFILSGFYVWRLVMGGILGSVVLSPWLLGFGFFIFLSIGFVKRYSELRAVAELPSEGKNSRRGYEVGDIGLIQAMGICSGIISSMVLALYITSEKSSEIYLHPERLWIACPLLLFWVLRIWLLANRGKLLDDPVSFSLKDKCSYFLVLIIFLLPFLAEPIQ